VTRISAPACLNRVRHIIGSGTGVLEFAVEGESEYYAWEGNEDADWEVDDVGQVENIEEDRFIMYPSGESFVCEVEEGASGGVVRCWSETE